MDNKCCLAKNLKTNKQTNKQQQQKKAIQLGSLLNSALKAQSV